MKCKYQSYPACGGCGTELLVEGYTGTEAYICHGCGTTFDRGGQR